ncbi:hypothetical protein B0H13DRAFT_2383728 [Mycena leptocephala]|nr:hypothetical protein B0H13DRAFT_2383728 [Mycena leptocephala]
MANSHSTSTNPDNTPEMSLWWPTGFAFHRQYLLVILPSSVQIRHIETGLVSQVILGLNLRLLFAHRPLSVGNDGGDGQMGCSKAKY